MFKWFSQKKTEENQDTLNLAFIPKHVAIIMDGNGRWAKEKGMPRIAGHKEGMATVKKITKAANELGVKVLTLYAFSTENWNRPEQEVKFLMNLPLEFLSKEIDEIMEQNVRVKIIGFVDQLPKHTYAAVKEAEERTKENTGMILNFALNYGARHEILYATKNIVEQVHSGNLKIDDIDEEVINNNLLTKDLPDPDLLIRTSGEVRISNFLLWQLAYTELWFTDVYWPDFNKELFYQAIYDYQKRNRRFGAL